MKFRQLLIIPLAILLGHNYRKRKENQRCISWAILPLKMVRAMVQADYGAGAILSVSFWILPRVNGHNRARGGRSSRTFLYEGLWDSVKKQLGPADFVLIQFGHNDAGNIDTEKYRGSLPGTGNGTQIVERPDGSLETVHTSGWYMKKYIEESHAKGAIPIVMSLTPRNEWPQGRLEQRRDSYVAWSKQAAKEKDALFIDLRDSLAQRYQELGREKVKDFFPRDHTHNGVEGAKFNATVAAQALKNCDSCDLRDYIVVPKR